MISDNMHPDVNAENIIDFPTSYDKILERIYNINPVDYGKTRNYINGDVTYLSPYISRGIISVRQVLESVSGRGFEPFRIQKFIQELAWREYFQRIWQHLGDKISEDIRNPQKDVLHHEMINSIHNASTGISAVDHAIHEFYKTGYLHNHLRMYIASLACNLGSAHWKQPSSWMYYHLLDGDVANNNCSWQWIAGSFSSKKYYFNQDNVNQFTSTKQQNTFIDKNYESIKEMSVPDSLQGTTLLHFETTLPVTQRPLIDLNYPTLIYNSYNLDVEWRTADHFNRVLLLEPSHFKKYPVGEKVLQFIISLAKNVEGIQIFNGEINEISELYSATSLNDCCIISKEHPAFMHYPGIKDKRDWMFENVSGYFPSFFSFWKKCEKSLQKNH